jgi:hypothetical protein
MKRLVVTAGVSIMLAGAAASPARAQARPQPVFPATPVISNPYLPMQPGVSLGYDGKIGGKPEHDVVTTLGSTKTITGIHCVVQRDTGWVSGIVVEVTFDYFAQDTAGNVWYMGEFATQYAHGKPAGHSGSWQAGRGGAAAGIIMEAHPSAGDSYLQESFPGHALDAATVLSTTASVSVPLGTWLGNVLLTKEFSQLEPGQVEHKWYVSGIGNVRATQVRGKPSEYLNLTGITFRPPHH